MRQYNASNRRVRVSRHARRQLLFERLEDRALLAVFTVNADTFPDFDQNPGDGRCDFDLATPGEQCTFNTAIDESNALNGKDIIQFAIVNSTSNSRPVTDSVIIDGGGTARIDGTVAIRASDSTVRHMAFVHRVEVENSDGHTIVGNVMNFLSLLNSSNNTIGGGEAERNVIQMATLLIRNGSNNLVEGNFIGLDETGLQLVSGNSSFIGVFVDGDSDNNTFKNNVIAGFTTAIAISDGETSNNQVLDNMIGVGIDGNPIGSGQTGITVRGMDHRIEGNIIAAGTFGMELHPDSERALVQNNTVSGAKGDGMRISGFEHTVKGNTIVGTVENTGFPSGFGMVVFSPDAANANRGHLIQGNLIGTDASGNDLGNAKDGIRISGSGNLIGGTNPGEANVIAHNGGNGIFVADGFFDPAATRNRISGNAIFDNGGLGIDLEKLFGPGTEPVTLNDPDDTDTGSNELQNFPVVSIAPSGLVSATLQSSANTNYTIEFFANDECDPSGHGEGQFFLGAFNTSTNSSGDASLTSVFVAPSVKYITATATDANGNTSEFSACKPSPFLPPRPILLSGQKYEDVDRSGSKSVDEPRLPGWEINLDLNSDGTIDGVTTTDANGNYAFNAIAAARNVNISRKPGGQAETTIAINPTNPNNIIAAANDSRSIFGTVSLDVIYVSMDGGQTWTERTVPLPSGAQASHGDPTIAFDRTGRAVFAHMVDQDKNVHGSGVDERHSIATAVSTDGGLSWTASMVAPFVDTEDHDKLIIASGPSRNDPNVDRFYITWTRLEPVRSIVISSSTDGITWSDPVRVDDGTGPLKNGPSTVNSAIPAVGPNGEVYVAWYNFGAIGSADVFFDVSLDGGQTWGIDRLVYRTSVNKFGDPRFSDHVYRIPAQPHRGINAGLSMDVDRSSGPHHGRIYLTVTDQGDLDGDPDAGNALDHNDTDIFLLASDDDGANWNANGPNPVLVNFDEQFKTSQFFPWLDVDQTTGLVAIAWHDARNDLGTGGPADRDGAYNTEVQLYASVSFDGGATFAPNMQISQGASLGRFGRDGFNFGDYTGLAFHDGVFYPIWADNSNSTGDNPDGTLSFMDVYTARVSVIGFGTHRIREVQQPGWELINPFAPSSHLITVFDGDVRGNLDFGNFKLATISGRKFADLNGNGMRDNGEPGLAGWTIFLNPIDTNGDGIFDTGARSTVTGADGYYEFKDVAAGNYTIGEQRQPQWLQTAPSPLPPGTHAVVVAGAMSGERYEDRNFANEPAMSLIYGEKFHDLNGNGVRDTGEPGLKDWVIFIDGNGDGVLNNSTSGNGVCDEHASDPCQRTAEDGSYLFANLPAGVYPIFEVQQPGWRKTTNAPANVAVDGTQTAFIGPQFGNFKLGTIVGEKFNDRNGDGERQRNEQGLTGRTIYLDLNSDGVLNNPTGNGVCGPNSEPCAVTDANGEYQIGGLLPGTYRVREVAQPKFVQTFPSNPEFHTVTITTSGQVVKLIDFGNFDPPPVAELLDPPPGQTADMDLGYIEVRWTDPNDPTGIDVSTVDVSDVTITSSGRTVSIERVENRGGGVFRYIYNDDGERLIAGDVTVTFAARAVLDQAGNPSLESTATFTLAVSGLDFGDAPLASQSGFASDYPTRLPTGASHVLGSGLVLGTSVDGETDGQPNAAADGDGDDDDGITFLTSMFVSPTFDTIASLLVSAPLAGKLDMWIDFNRDGDWLDDEEQLFGGSIDVAGGRTLVGFLIPAGASPGFTYARFRLSSTGNLAPSGPAIDGEVEDYRVELLSAATTVDVQLPQNDFGPYLLGIDSGYVGVVTIDEVPLFLAPVGAVGQINIKGTAQADVLSLETSLGAIKWTADMGDGDDLVELGASDFQSIDGGPGHDLVTLIADDLNMDLTQASANQVMEFEELDLRGSLRTNIKLNLSAVQRAVGNNGTLLIRHDNDQQVTYGTGWAVSQGRIVNGKFWHEISQSGVTVQIANNRPWQNPVNRLDANRDNEFSPVDIGVVIFTINLETARALPDPAVTGELPRHFYDVSGDGEVSPVDAAIGIVNLNNPLAGEAESPSQLLDAPTLVAYEPIIKASGLSATSDQPVCSRIERSTEHGGSDRESADQNAAFVDIPDAVAMEIAARRHTRSSLPLWTEHAADWTWEALTDSAIDAILAENDMAVVNTLCRTRHGTRWAGR